MLWEIKAVHFNAAQHYQLSSGMASPVSIDCSTLLSFPRIRSPVMDFAASTLLRDADFDQFACIAGGAPDGIPPVALLAYRL
ncbi:orotate phosphoribosyltransferase, partial [Rhizobium johnstonii]